NTEETLSAFNFARDTHIPVAAITAGGILLESVRRVEAPYIEIPNTGIQPRMSVGLQMKALLKLLGYSDGLRALGRLHDTFDPARYMGEGEVLAHRLRGYVPVIYASRANGPLSYVTKIQLNETGKMPAFSNVVPELNHNEMTGFDRVLKTKELSERFHFVFLKDIHDDPNIVRRMNVLERIYKEKGLPVTPVMLNEADPFRKIFVALIIAAWTAYYLARYYDVDPENVPLVEEFKRRIR
ncbi:MAG: SIS domain-containing protein, partial [bacterium]|nr:SIS domain-containing protein [bacterium]